MLDFLKKNINFIGFLILFSMIISLSAFSYAQYVSNSQNAVDKSLPFSDVPENSYAYEPIHRLRSMGVTQGIGSNRFGYGRTITRAEFITMLINLLDLDGEVPQQGSFSDNMDPKKFYFRPIETALKNGIITNETDSFRPGDPITRQAAVVMIIISLSYGKL
ncbi:MAG TPA: S-layer homology domain-containing protein, partial [Clostridiales bacterium]|nr:S-layer homology domain-containing protein [Clostridiales bacterium]